MEFRWAYLIKRGEGGRAHRGTRHVPGQRGKHPVGPSLAVHPERQAVFFEGDGPVDAQRQGIYTALGPDPLSHLPFRVNGWLENVRVVFNPKTGEMLLANSAWRHEQMIDAYFRHLGRKRPANEIDKWARGEIYPLGTRVMVGFELLDAAVPFDDPDFEVKATDNVLGALDKLREVGLPGNSQVQIRRYVADPSKDLRFELGNKSYKRVPAGQRVVNPETGKVVRGGQPLPRGALPMGGALPRKNDARQAALLNPNWANENKDLLYTELGPNPLAHPLFQDNRRVRFLYNPSTGETIFGSGEYGHFPVLEAYLRATGREPRPSEIDKWVRAEFDNFDRPELMFEDFYCAVPEDDPDYNVKVMDNVLSAVTRLRELNFPPELDVFVAGSKDLGDRHFALGEKRSLLQRLAEVVEKAAGYKRVPKGQKIVNPETGKIVRGGQPMPLPHTEQFYPGHLNDELPAAEDPQFRIYTDLGDYPMANPWFQKNLHGQGDYGKDAIRMAYNPQTDTMLFSGALRRHEGIIHDYLRQANLPEPATAIDSWVRGAFSYRSEGGAELELEYRYTAVPDDDPDFKFKAENNWLLTLQKLRDLGFPPNLKIYLDRNRPEDGLFDEAMVTLVELGEKAYQRVPKGQRVYNPKSGKMVRGGQPVPKPEKSGGQVSTADLPGQAERWLLDHYGAAKVDDIAGTAWVTPGGDVVVNEGSHESAADDLGQALGAQWRDIKDLEQKTGLVRLGVDENSNSGYFEITGNISAAQYRTVERVLKSYPNLSFYFDFYNEAGTRLWGGRGSEYSYHLLKAIRSKTTKAATYQRVPAGQRIVNPETGKVVRGGQPVPKPEKYVGMDAENQMGPGLYRRMGLDTDEQMGPGLYRRMYLSLGPDPLNNKLMIGSLRAADERVRFIVNPKTGETAYCGPEYRHEDLITAYLRYAGRERRVNAIDDWVRGEFYADPSTGRPAVMFESRYAAVSDDVTDYDAKVGTNLALAMQSLRDQGFPEDLKVHLRLNDEFRDLLLGKAANYKRVPKGQKVVNPKTGKVVRGGQPLPLPENYWDRMLNFPEKGAPMFHGTPETNAESILKQGLLRQHGGFRMVENKGEIYLAKTPGLAAWAGMVASLIDDAGQFAVFRVRQPQDLQSDVDSLMQGGYKVARDIAPGDILEVKKYQVKESVRQEYQRLRDKSIFKNAGWPEQTALLHEAAYDLKLYGPDDVVDGFVKQEIWEKMVEPLAKSGAGYGFVFGPDAIARIEAFQETAEKAANYKRVPAGQRVINPATGKVVRGGQPLPIHTLPVDETNRLYTELGPEPLKTELFQNEHRVRYLFNPETGETIYGPKKYRHESLLDAYLKETGQSRPMDAIDRWVRVEIDVLRDGRIEFNFDHDNCAVKPDSTDYMTKVSENLLRAVERLQGAGFPADSDVFVSQMGGAPPLHFKLSEKAANYKRVPKPDDEALKPYGKVVPDLSAAFGGKLDGYWILPDGKYFRLRVPNWHLMSAEGLGSWARQVGRKEIEKDPWGWMLSQGYVRLVSSRRRDTPNTGRASFIYDSRAGNEALFNVQEAVRQYPEGWVFEFEDELTGMEHRYDAPGREEALNYLENLLSQKSYERVPAGQKVVNPKTGKIVRGGQPRPLIDEDPDSPDPRLKVYDDLGSRPLEHPLFQVLKHNQSVRMVYNPTSDEIVFGWGMRVHESILTSYLGEDRAYNEIDKWVRGEFFPSTRGARAEFDPRYMAVVPGSTNEQVRAQDNFVSTLNRLRRAGFPSDMTVEWVPPGQHRWQAFELGSKSYLGGTG